MPITDKGLSFAVEVMEAVLLFSCAVTAGSSEGCPGFHSPRVLVQVSPNLESVVLDGCTDITDGGVRFVAHWYIWAFCVPRSVYL